MHPRTRQRIEWNLLGLLAIVALPILLPVLASYIAGDNCSREAGRKSGPRYGRFWIRVWWWYGYHGLYQLDWAMKRRHAN